MTPKFSIIVTVCNVAEYISECVSSITVQGFRDFELILVDDGSTDDSGALCDEFAMTDARIKVIHQQNAGVSVARNAGLAAASGTYIWFVDGDDWIDQNALETLHENLSGAELDAFAFSHTNYSDADQIFSKISNPQDIAVTSGAGFIAQSVHFFTSVCTYVFRRDFLTANAFRFMPGIRHEDDYFLLSVFGKIKRIAKRPVSLYFYRRRVGSLMTSQAKDILEIRFRSYVRLIELLETIEDLNREFLTAKTNEYKSSLFDVLLDYCRTDATAADKSGLVAALKDKRIDFPVTAADRVRSKKLSMLKFAFNLSGKLFLMLNK